MANFQQAIQWMIEGKKVTHPRMPFKTDFYYVKLMDIYHCRSDSKWTTEFGMNEFMADDWEIFPSSRTNKTKCVMCKLNKCTSDYSKDCECDGFNVPDDCTYSIGKHDAVHAVRETEEGK